jgi:2-hydroxy-3-keto-5-methylthiopentenyl-1-phosphate phosphatase
MQEIHIYDFDKTLTNEILTTYDVVSNKYLGNKNLFRDNVKKKFKDYIEQCVRNNIKLIILSHNLTSNIICALSSLIEKELITKLTIITPQIVGLDGSAAELIKYNPETNFKCNYIKLLLLSHKMKAKIEFFDDDISNIKACIDLPITTNLIVNDMSLKFMN